MIFLQRRSVLSVKNKDKVSRNVFFVYIISKTVINIVMEKEYRLLLTGLSGCGLIYLCFAYMEMTLWGYGVVLCAAGIYLFYLLKITKSRISSQKQYTFLAGLVGYLFIINLAFGALQIMKAQNQHDTLTNIREDIDTNVISIEFHKDMLKTLKAYHQQSDKSNSIVDTYVDVMGDKLSKNGTINTIYGKEGKAFNGYYELAGKEKVEVIAVTEISKGKNPEFDNYDQNSGKIQIEISLTEEGIDYERVN